MEKRIEYPTDLDRKTLMKYVAEKKDQLVAQKKAMYKWGDGCVYLPLFGEDKDDAVGKTTKLEGNEMDTNALKVTAIINTTNWMDSHYDVHLPKLWNKSLKQNKMIMHVQEHSMWSFEKIISSDEDLKAYVKDYSWKELGFDYSGKTQALVFDSVVRKDRNETMFRQYAKGYVKNHSVGMRYVSIVSCINDDEYGAQYEAWEKYFPMVANKEFAEEKGFFWAVKEAKAIEGSAVPLGSNVVTPTISVEAASKSASELEKEKLYNFYLNQ